MYGRLSAVPELVDTLQPTRMTAALAAGQEIIRLRHVARRLHIAADLEPAMTAIAAGDSSRAIDALDRFDRTLAELPAVQPGARLRLRARATVYSVTDALSRHASFFDAKVGT